MTGRLFGAKPLTELMQTCSQLIYMEQTSMEFESKYGKFPLEISVNWQHLHASMCLPHWGPVMHICVGKLTIIGSDNGLSSGRHQTIIWTSAVMLLIGTLGINFSETLRNSNLFIQENVCENVVCEMASILSRSQWVNDKYVLVWILLWCKLCTTPSSKLTII